jgi:hypothetical protein
VVAGDGRLFAGGIDGPQITLGVMGMVRGFVGDGLFGCGEG